MLHAVVGDDDLGVGVGGKQQAGGLGAAGGNGGGGAGLAIKHQGFVACLRGGAGGGE